MDWARIFASLCAKGGARDGRNHSVWPQQLCNDKNFKQWPALQDPPITALTPILALAVGWRGEFMPVVESIGYGTK